MRKIKFLSTLALVGTAVFGLTACSSSDDVTEGGSESGETQYITVNLTNVGTNNYAGAKKATRASYPVNGGNYEDGTEAENTITSARFYFFTNSGDPYIMTSGTNYVDVNTFTMADGDHNATVEKKTSAVIVINGVTGTVPRSMMTVVNLSDEVKSLLGATTLTQEQLLAATQRLASAHNADNTGFVMTNSIYDDGGTPVTTTSTDGHIATSEKAATDNPVEVYVERLDAKVRLSYGITSPTSITYYTKNGSIVASTTEGATSQTSNVYKVGTTDAGTDVYALVKGWGVADEQPSASLFKDFKQTYYKDWGTYTSTNTLGFTWNDASLHRSYWEKTPELGVPGNTVVNHSFNDYVANAGRSELYTHPNTPLKTDGFSTAAKSPTTTSLGKVVLVAQLVAKQEVDGKDEWLPIEVCSYKSLEVIGVENVKKAVCADLKALGYVFKSTSDGGTTTADITTDDITFIPYEAGRKYEVVPQVKAKDGYTLYKSDATANLDDLNNKTLKTDTYRADVRTSGDTYYYTPIRHLAPDVDPKTVTKDDDYKLGYYGVVRNHVYAVNITGITGFGTPVFDPTKEFDPITPTNEASYIAARINVLSWRLVSQNANIDGSVLTGK